MNVGECLDTAAAALTSAITRIRAVDQPHPYDIYGTLTARDLVYQGLGRLTTLIRDQAPGEHLGWEDIPLLLGPDMNGRYLDSGLVLAASIQVARLGREHTDFALLTQHGTIPALVAPAANAIDIAAEIIATHLNPSEPPRLHGGRSTGARRNERQQALTTLGRLTDARFRTVEGAALSTGAQREEALGEVAKLAGLAIEVDRAMMHWADAWYNGESLHLRKLINSPIPNALQRIGRSPPATLLRELVPAPVLERPTGPRRVETIKDVHTAVATARMAVRNQWSQATIGVATQAALLGFALTAAASHINGEDSGPSPRTEEHGFAWRSIAAAANKLADTRGGSGQPLAIELGSAAFWIRQQIRIAQIAQPVLARSLINTEQELRKLCGEMIRPLRYAADHRMVMAGRPYRQKRVEAGVQLTNVLWHVARGGHPAMAELARTLRAASQLPPTTHQATPDAQTAANLGTALQAASGLHQAFPTRVGQSTNQPPPLTDRRTPTAGELAKRRSRDADRDFH